MVEYVGYAINIITAFISAWALIKVNKIDNKDRIHRSLWALEEYMFILGKYINSPNDENRDLYHAHFMLCILYADEEMRKKLLNIDSYVSKSDIEKAKIEAINFSRWYSKKYDTQRYSPEKNKKIRFVIK